MDGSPVTGHRKPAERGGKDIEEEQGDDELRGRHPDKGGHHDRAVEKAAAIEGCDGAEDDAEKYLKEDASGHQFSLLFYSDKTTANQLFSELLEHPLTNELTATKQLTQLRAPCGDDRNQDAIEASSDPRWPSTGAWRSPAGHP